MTCSTCATRAGQAPLGGLCRPCYELTPRVNLAGPNAARAHVRISEELLGRVRVAAVAAGSTVAGWVSDVLNERLGR